MSEKDLKINFRYLTGNIACMSVDSVKGEPVHNDINNEEAIILFNSLVGEKEGCTTLKTLLEENQKLKGVIETYEIIIKSTNVLNWNELKKWLEERIDYLTEIDGQHIPLNDSFEFCSMNELYQTGKYSGLKDSLEKMQELENRKV